MNLFIKSILNAELDCAFYHKTRKEWGFLDNVGRKLTKEHSCSDSIFINFDGEYLEVTANLLDTVEPVRD